MNSAGTLGGDDFLFVPPLVSLMRNRRLKSRRARCSSATARPWCRRSPTSSATTEEDIWVRRHVPSTLALLPCDASVDVLVSALDDPTGSCASRP